MSFARPGGGVLELSDAAVQTLLRHRQLRPADTEAGGVLLGRLIQGSSDVVIDVATPPSPSDRRSRFSFFRARKPAQEAVDRAWRQSGQVVNYLGEWHSHPEDHPSPSCIDKRDWKKILTHATFEQDFLVFIIVGRLSVRAWEVSRMHPVPRALTAPSPHQSPLQPESVP